MDHIAQLKKIRAEAIARMRNSADFKLAGRLGLLIVELGDTVEDKVDFEEIEEPAPVAATPTGPAVATGFGALAETTSTAKPFEATFSKPDADDFKDLTSDDIIDELVAEIEIDAAELDALAAADSAEDNVEDDLPEEDKKIGPFVKPDILKGRFTNGTGIAH